jgi:hypothetical protein
MFKTLDFAIVFLDMIGITLCIKTSLFSTYKFKIDSTVDDGGAVG